MDAMDWIYPLMRGEVKRLQALTPTKTDEQKVVI